MKSHEANPAGFFAEWKQSSESLKPCPFCGNKEVELILCRPPVRGKRILYHPCFWQILCPECAAQMEYDRLKGQTQEEAKAEIIAAWNRRTLPDSLPD